MDKTTLTVKEQTEKYGKIATECPKCGTLFFVDRSSSHNCQCGKNLKLDQEVHKKAV